MNDQHPIHNKEGFPAASNSEIVLCHQSGGSAGFGMEEEASCPDLADCLSRVLDRLVETVEGWDEVCHRQELAGGSASPQGDGNPAGFLAEDSFLLPVAPISTSRRDFQVQRGPEPHDFDAFWY